VNNRFVEYETKADLLSAVEKLDGREFKGQNVHCIADEQAERPRDRYRSRSPRGNYRGGPARGGDEYYGGGGREYDRRGGYDRDYDYRRRSPPREPYPYPAYDNRDRYARPPSRGPPRRGPVDDYPPPRARYDDPYAAPARGYALGYDDMNEHAAHNASRPPYGPPSPRQRGRTPPPPGYDARPRYW
jgi:transcription initiation factor TFIID subunit 15